MKYLCFLFLTLAVGGCMGTSERGESCPRVDAGPAARAKSPAALTLEPYPPVPLRSDLGESLVECERERVLDSMDAVKEVIELRRDRDPANFGRGDHAKPLGCYKAVFTVSAPDVVRADDQVGIARRENLGRTFSAIVRLSNSDPKNVPDFRSATTGLAVKVRLDSVEYSKNDFLPGEGGDRYFVQDFVAGGLKTFVASGIGDYADLFRLRIHQYSNALVINGRHPEALQVFGIDPWLRYFNLSSNAAPMVLQEQFSSLVPYAWGDSAVKFRFESCHKFRRDAHSFSRFDTGYQTKVLSEFLQNEEICYIMKIQKRPRAGSADERTAIEKAFPVEDAMVEWPGSEGTSGVWSTEFREVARLRIQVGTAPMKDDECEKLAFSPWNGLRAHQPLGSLNRARWAVYKQSETVRDDIE